MIAEFILLYIIGVFLLTLVIMKIRRHWRGKRETPDLMRRVRG